MSLCPVCREPLVIFDLASIEADLCVDGHGTWLDSGEIELIAREVGLDPAALAGDFAAVEVLRTSDRRCPRCSKRMEVIKVGADAKGMVELDRCPRGHGLWFDRGEMKTLLAHHAENESAPELIRRLGQLFMFETATVPQEGTP